jgi:hypothetical protein
MQKIGEGREGKVYIDPMDSGKVIKVYNSGFYFNGDKAYTKRKEILKATKELRLAGVNTPQIYEIDYKNSCVEIKMDRIFGIPLKWTFVGGEDAIKQLYLQASISKEEWIKAFVDADQILKHRPFELNYFGTDIIWTSVSGMFFVDFIEGINRYMPSQDGASVLINGIRILIHDIMQYENWYPKDVLNILRETSEYAYNEYLEQKSIAP